MRGGFAEPLERGLVFRLAVDAFGVENRKVVHGSGIALLGSRGVEAARGLEVLLHAVAFFIEAAQPILRRRKPLRCGTLEPARCLAEALGNAAAFGIADGDLV